MKEYHKQALLERAQNAIDALYHNATPRFDEIPEKLYEIHSEWFSFACEQEFSYVKEGLGLTAKEWARYVKLGFTANERYYWLVKRITEYGDIFQYGRGGRTVAPCKLVKDNGAGFRLRQIDDKYYTASDLTELCQIVEAFNTYVENWNSKENLTTMWRDYVDSNCPGCESPVTEKIWTAPLELMCRECAELLAPKDVA